MRDEESWGALSAACEAKPSTPFFDYWVAVALSVTCLMDRASIISVVLLRMSMYAGAVPSVIGPAHTSHLSRSCTLLVGTLAPSRIHQALLFNSPAQATELVHQLYAGSGAASSST